MAKHTQQELIKIARIKNKSLQNVITAFELAQMKSHQKEDNDSFLRCENYRAKLRNDNTIITYEAFLSDRTALVKDICRIAASEKKWCQLLYYLVKSIDNPKILEIGTNLGVSGSYLLEALKGKGGNFITMEGLPQLCEIAKNQFSTIVPDSNFEVVEGRYDETFPKTMEKDIKYDLIFIDGNHKKKPTLEYFESLKVTIDQAAIFVFDDIFWSSEMEEVWEIIKRDSDINFSIDIIRKQGIVVIDRNESIYNKHFNLTHFI